MRSCVCALGYTCNGVSTHVCPTAFPPARAGVFTGLAAYTYLSFWGPEALHWLHGYAISFVVACVATMMLSERGARPERMQARDAASGLPPLDPWGGAKLTGALCAGAALSIYLGLSLIAG